MNIINTYACYGADNNERLSSSSGGIFSIIAKNIINNDGIVYGVAMSKDCYTAEFIGITDESELYKLRSSKYMQAKLGETYRKVRDNLDQGMKVLFSGTGCQVNGLKSFLGKDYDSLLCIDVICHGVPSPYLWRKYVEYQEQENNGKLKYVNFRCKYKSWTNFGMEETIDRMANNDLKKLYISKDKDYYMQMFLRDYCLRPSCYNCIAKRNKQSDLTIGDFWGIDKVAPEMNDGKGTSLVITRTSKGQKFFEAISSKMDIKEVTYEAGVKENPSEFKSVTRPVQRNYFFDDMYDMSFDELKKKYSSPVKLSFHFRVKRKIKNIIKNIFGRNRVTQNSDYYTCYMFDNRRC